MEQHPWFDLRLHSDDELSALLNATITGRETLHEWPLSCVQRVTTAGGTQWIYKTQTGPTIESLFYAQVQSNLLVAARTIYQQHGHTIMLLEYVNAPLMSDLRFDAAAAVQIGRDVQQRLDVIAEDAPVLFDMSSPAAWRRMVNGAADELRRLITGGQFQHTTLEAVSHMQRRALDSAILAAVSRRCGLVHGDLTGDNLFILPNGNYRLIDWSRPFRGPVDIDLAALLDSLGHDPLDQLDRSAVIMLYMLRVEWFTQCAVRWFTPGVPAYDQQIMALIGRMLDI